MKMTVRLTNSVEETVDGEIGDLTSLGVADCDRLEKVLRRHGAVSQRGREDSDEERTYTIPLGLDGLRVPENRDLGVRQQSLRHDLGGPELVSSDEHVDVRRVL